MIFKRLTSVGSIPINAHNVELTSGIIAKNRNFLKFFAQIPVDLHEDL